MTSRLARTSLAAIAALALTTLAGDAHPYTKGFAVKGLGALKSAGAVPMLIPLAEVGRGPLAVQAIRALGRIGEPGGAPPLLKIAENPRSDPLVRLEAVAALGGIRAPGVFELLLVRRGWTRVLRRFQHEIPADGKRGEHEDVAEESAHEGIYRPCERPS